MQLDVRIPIGLMFTMLGALLFTYGLLTASNSAMYARSLGYNVNLWWGLFLAVFGALMLGLARRAARRQGAETGRPEPMQETGAP